jgi:hypothetical protein
MYHIAKQSGGAGLGGLEDFERLCMLLRYYSCKFINRYATDSSSSIGICMIKHLIEFTILSFW